MSQKYAALIVDLKKSRSYSESYRYAIQSHLIRVLAFLNDIFYGDIIRRVDFSAGDEMQGLFTTVESAYLYYRFLAMWLHPVKIRAGIGVGTWDLQIADRGTTSQDGKAYHYARDAINNANDADGYSLLIYSGTPNDIGLNTIISGAATITENLSPNQNQLLLVTEILFPICLQSDVDFILKHPNTFDLLQEKSYFDHEIGNITKDLPLDHIQCSNYSDLNIRCALPKENLIKELNQGAFFITSGKQWGIQTEIAKVLSIKRQTIARSLNNGNVFIARNMAMTALYEMRDLG